MHNLTKRSVITSKVEAGVASSVAILEMLVNISPTVETLLEFMEDLCTTYFEPLFQLLSSKNHTFPGGTDARATICQSAVQLLKDICVRLGRDRASEVLILGLKSFFNCFSVAHGIVNDQTLLMPIEGHFSGTPTNEDSNSKTLSQETNSVACEQVMGTFSRDLVHHAYVDFCKSIGQITLANHLTNIEAIEELHASYSQEGMSQPVSPLPSLLGLSSNKMESSGSSEESNDDLDIDYKLGPSTALSGRSGLGRDSVTFGQSSWLVDEDVDASPEKAPPTSPHITTGLVSTIKNTLAPAISPHKAPDQIDNVGVAMGRGPARFDAKFGSVTESVDYDG